MLLEYEPLTTSARSLALAPGEQHFYVFFVGTREDCRGRGLASSLLRNYQSRATAANMPIWLEATTAKSRDIYLKLGFESVQEIVLGKGRVGSDGLVVKASGDGDGEKEAIGVQVWGMVWRPEGYKYNGKR
jgi:Acetyltransferase (GNAT) domain